MTKTTPTPISRFNDGTNTVSIDGMSYALPCSIWKGLRDSHPLPDSPSSWDMDQKITIFSVCHYAQTLTGGKPMLEHFDTEEAYEGFVRLLAEAVWLDTSRRYLTRAIAECPRDTLDFLFTVPEYNLKRSMLLSSRGWGQQVSSLALSIEVRLWEMDDLKS